MSDQPSITAAKRQIWSRGLLMILMALAYQLASTVLLFLALIQFVITLTSDAPNERLRAFGISVGRYLGQIANFQSFATEDLPFPFADWPSAN